MDKVYMYKIMRETIDKYLNSYIEKNDLAKQLIGKISPTEAAECNDELLAECFFTLYHMDEYGCDASEDELLYLKDCLEGKKKFSKDERDSII